jgi:FkbM family methyltransferase
MKPLSILFRDIRVRLHVPILIHGVLLEVHKVSSNKIRKALLLGKYERTEIQLLRDEVKNNDVVLDCGSGLGITSSFAGKLAQNGRVFGFEAHPKIHKISQSTIKLNGLRNVVVESGILSNQDGEVDFFEHQNFWSSSLHPTYPSVKIKTKSHNTCLILTRIKPTVVVMDIEGGEYDLLKNPCWLQTESIRAIIIEIHRPKNADMLDVFKPFFANPWIVSMTFQELQQHLAKHNHTCLKFIRNK